MVQFFTSLMASLGSYFVNAEYDHFAFWLYVCLPLVATWVVVKAVLLASSDPKRDQGTRVVVIHKTYVWSIAAILTVLIAVYIFLWGENYYVNKPHQSAHLLSILIASTLLFLSFMALRNLFSKERIQDLFSQPLSRQEEEVFLNGAKRSYRNLKLALLLPLLGFLALFLLITTSYTLISVVIDNSSSMGEANEKGHVPIETGKTALRNTIYNLRERADIIITTFEPDANYKTTVQEIVSASSWEELKGLNVFFSDSQKKEAINFVDNIEARDDIGSPICETIWKNFLFTREQREQKPYKEAISIIITDGKEIGVSSGLAGFFCDHANYHDFFGAGSGIYLIDLTGLGNNEFMEKALACGYAVEDGSDATLYELSLDRILRYFKRDWSFIYLMGIIYGAFALIILFIEPKN